MMDPKQIPFLIKLLDDESVDVQDQVVRDLASFGPTLKQELKNIDFPLSVGQKEVVDCILNDQKKITIKQRWPNWVVALSKIIEPEISNYKCLENGLEILAEFLNPAESNQSLSDMLDDLTDEYLEKYRHKDPRLLAQFLFQEKGLKGDEKDYYNPQNSNLIYVISEKKGIPISLATIYILVGARLGLDIEGCHFPGHFLARIDLYGRKAFVDCFSSGQIIREEDIIRIREDVLQNVETILDERASTESIMRRYLANLIRAFQIEENEEDSQLMIELFQDMDFFLTAKHVDDLMPDDIILDMAPQFCEGSIIKHARYGYRGIIVQIDEQCEAADEWYYANQSQPNRNQPWYHVLVHGSDQITYVAESNLLIDESDDEVVHPWLSYFFDVMEGGNYVRNENIWPECEE